VDIDWHLKSQIEIEIYGLMRFGSVHIVFKCQLIQKQKYWIVYEWRTQCLLRQLVVYFLARAA